MGVVDPWWPSEVRLSSVVGVTRKRSNEGAEVIDIFGAGGHAVVVMVVVFVAGLITVIEFLAGLDVAFLGVVVAH